MIPLRNAGSVRGVFTRAAAPEGGAQRWVRGCALIFAVFSMPVWAQPVPSGIEVELHEVLVDEVEGQSWLRFRFLAPDISREKGQVSYEDAAGDMDMLCNEMAVPYIGEWQVEATRVAISISDRIVPFGTPDPDATQFIEVYRIEDGACIWEAF